MATKQAKCKKKDNPGKHNPGKHGYKTKKASEVNRPLADAVLMLLDKRATSAQSASKADASLAKFAGLGMGISSVMPPTGKVDARSLLSHGLAGAGLGALGGGVGALLKRDRSLADILKGALGTGVLGGSLGVGSDALAQLLPALKARFGGGAQPSAQPSAAPTAQAGVSAPPKQDKKPSVAPASQGGVSAPPKQDKKPAEKKPDEEKAAAILRKFAEDTQGETKPGVEVLESASDTAPKKAPEKKPEPKDSENESEKKGDD